MRNATIEAPPNGKIQVNKTLTFRLLGLGAIPKALRPALESEGIVVADEGMPGWFVTKNVDAPGRRYRHRSEGFSGCLVVTGKRLVCYTYRKRQINMAADDPRISAIHADAPDAGTLSLSFESSAFRKGWNGVIELRFRTDRARAFLDALRAMGVRHGTAGGSEDI